MNKVPILKTINTTLRLCSGCDHRNKEPELMDDLAGSSDDLFTTYRHFALINRLFSRDRFLVRKLLLPHMLKQNRPLTLVDIGSGPADFARWFSALACKKGLDVTIYCVDKDPRALKYAASVTENIENVHCVEGDFNVLREWDKQIDYIVANHLLHHLDDCRIPSFLHLCSSTAKCGVMINDLRRSFWALTAFMFFALFFLRRGYSRIDGLYSIAAGFTKRDIDGYLQKVHLSDEWNVHTYTPSRIVVSRFKR